MLSFSRARPSNYAAQPRSPTPIAESAPSDREVAAAIEALFAGSSVASDCLGPETRRAILKLKAAHAEQVAGAAAELSQFSADVSSTGANIGWITYDVQQVSDNSTAINSAVTELAELIGQIAQTSQSSAADASRVRDGVPRKHCRYSPHRRGDALDRLSSKLDRPALRRTRPRRAPDLGDGGHHRDHFAPDQPARAQCDHRGRPGRSGGARLCRRRRRGQEAFGRHGQGDRGDPQPSHDAFRRHGIDSPGDRRIRRRRRPGRGEGEEGRGEDQQSRRRRRVDCRAHASARRPHHAPGAGERRDLEKRRHHQREGEEASPGDRLVACPVSSKPRKRPSDRCRRYGARGIRPRRSSASQARQPHGAGALPRPSSASKLPPAPTRPARGGSFQLGRQA